MNQKIAKSLDQWRSLSSPILSLRLPRRPLVDPEALHFSACPCILLILDESDDDDNDAAYNYTLPEVGSESHAEGDSDESDEDTADTFTPPENAHVERDQPSPVPMDADEDMEEPPSRDLESSMPRHSSGSKVASPNSSPMVQAPRVISQQSDPQPKTASPPLVDPEALHFPTCPCICKFLMNLMMTTTMRPITIRFLKLARNLTLKGILMNLMKIRPIPSRLLKMFPR
ncbi:hypothetical protein K435DRAFT_386187 [Dendrothele bispora CBS 962.96]|uniref:Uncharacterized protein n=1 Tax=Dendrothele bispora (strain CBS 962.96) TaxID=1314807 RepID=A0A4S8L9T1_DENBC|nr:hypothetical protein K435DRAFT_386187 [Dendrothele bispora CBS 962.96]